MEACESSEASLSRIFSSGKRGEIQKKSGKGFVSDAGVGGVADKGVTVSNTLTVALF